MAHHSISTVLSGGVTPGTEVTVRGWLRSKRDSKAGFSFLSIHDGSCFSPLQAVVDASLPNYAEEILKLTVGCSVIVTGVVVVSEGEKQSLEVQARHVEVCGLVDDPETYPIAKKKHSYEYLRQVAHLRPRTNTFGAIARIRSALAQSIHQYFGERGFCWVNTPIITGSDCEGAGEMFRVSTLDLENLPREASGAIDFSHDFFGQETFLTVSGQLNAETYCMALSKVYTFGPTFRAENSNTTRHLAEFWMVEPEIAFANLADDANLAEEFLRYLIRNLLEKREDDLGFFQQQLDADLLQRLSLVCETPFARIDYSDAITILQKSGREFSFPAIWGHDLQTEHERFLAETHVKGPVVITNYPKDIKAFYMRLNDDGQTVAAMDVLVPGIGEIIGGSQREERLEVYDRRVAEMGIKGELSWYRDLRRYGTVPHAGFGMGFERLVTYVTGMENIRDAIPFPRTPHSARF
jgi:asparaginyl-tRNA synthetase